MVNDPDIRVRYQLAFTLGESSDSRVPRELALLGAKNPDQNGFVTAILSSSAGRADAVLELLLEQNPANAGRLVGELFRTVARSQSHEIPKLSAKLLNGSDLPAWRLEAAGALLGTKVPGLTFDSPEWRRAFESARTLAKNNDAPETDRVAGIQLLGRRPKEISEDIGVLTVLLGPDQPLSIQRAALRRIEQIDDPTVGPELLKTWSHAGAQTRAGIAALLLRREAWAKALLDQVEAGTLTAVDLGPTVQQQFLTHTSPAVRNRANKLFAAASSARDAVVREYVEKTRNLKGDAALGRALFEANCAICHKAGNLGTGAGPNLAMLYDRGPEQILTAILDPNRAVEDKYRNYVADLKNGEQVSGLLASESGNSITIVGINGIEQPIMRNEIRKLEAQNRSLMPEGFEQFLKPQDFADLITFIQNTTSQARN
jgi:putative heme-binding domain-containing protein